VAAAFLFSIIFYLKSTGEKRLLQDFGQEYEEYRQQVPMIVPWPGKMRRHA
jgi:protein-S-isoprenylcysteine O-methyltransferase Ste14